MFLNYGDLVYGCLFHYKENLNSYLIIKKLDYLQQNYYYYKIRKSYINNLNISQFKCDSCSGFFQLS